ncbi:MAG: hypothetical protein ACRETQ_03785, partial [Gammaproteobacteria bacterium]
MKIQIEALRARQAQTQREAELHTENLKLQSEALRAQQKLAKARHAHEHTQRLHDRIRTVYQSVLSLGALLILAIIAYGFYSAATDHSVVVNQFQVPPAFAAAGNSGTVVASDFLDQLQILQTATHSIRASRALQDAWSNNIRLQVPDVHVSLGDISRTLHAWLGHEIQIHGNVVQQGTQIALTVRGIGFSAMTFTGAPDSLPTLIKQAAEYVYGRAEPYLFVAYLAQHDRYTEARDVVKTAYLTASATDKPWFLDAWGSTLNGLNQYAAAAGKYREAIRLNPHFWLAYSNLTNIEMQLGEEEAAYRTGINMEQIAHRGSWFAARVPEMYYRHLGDLQMDLPAVHRAYLADEAAHGGVGAIGTDPVHDAGVLVGMHADRQASLILQTMPSLDSNHFIAAEDTDSVQGFMAMDQQNYQQAASDYEAEQALIAKYAASDPFNGTDAALLALADELSGHPDKADAVMATCGHFVDCYRFKADIVDHRGNWTQAQQDYQAAVNLAPSLPMAYESWGEALAHHGDYKDAIVKFEAAHQRGPHWCDPLKYWGDALAAEGNYRAAIGKYAEAAQYTP